MEPGPGRKECTTSDLERGRPDLEWLDIGKRAELSFLELNELRIRDLVDYVEIHLNIDSKVKVASQQDIDGFYAR